MAKPTTPSSTLEEDAVLTAVDVMKADDWLAGCHARTLAAAVRELRIALEKSEKRPSRARGRWKDDEIRRLEATIARIEAIMGGPGFTVGDTTLIYVKEVRAAIKG